ncbi:MAG: hypothetical protein ACE5HV_05355 [Acidobacteriota bacterium]
MFLNVYVALEMAPRVAELMAAELNRPERWQEDQIATFSEVARV